MKVILRVLLTGVSLAVTGMCVWLLFSCSPEEGELEDHIVNPPIEATESIEAQVLAGVEAPRVTPRDVFEERMPDEWLEEVDSITLSSTIGRIEGRAKSWGMDSAFLAEDLVDLIQVVVGMQPGFENGRHGGISRAMDIATDIYVAVGNERGSCDLAAEDMVPEVNAFVIASMGRRESSFFEDTERGYQLKNVGGKMVKNYRCRWCVGRAKERGMFQFMPTKGGRPGFVESMMPHGCNNPFNRGCSILTVVQYMNRLRCACIDQFAEECSLDAIVASYGRDTRHLVTPTQARHHRGPRKARGFLCEADPACDEHWPVDFDDDFALDL